MTIRQEIDRALEQARRADWRLEPDECSDLCAKLAYVMRLTDELEEQLKENARELRMLRQENRALKKLHVREGGCGT